MFCDPPPRCLAGMVALVGLLPSDGFQFAGDVTPAALPAEISIFFLRRRDEPKTATRLTQDRGSEQPLVKPCLFLSKHRKPPWFAGSRVLERLRLLNDKRCEC